jgi:His-Xaa-Ser system protein HxsD
MKNPELYFDAALHTGDAIQRAAYKMSDRLSCDLVRAGDGFRCTLHVEDGEIDATIAEFRNEVLDETLRERIRAETAEVRNLILALAYSRTGLVDAADS